MGTKTGKVLKYVLSAAVAVVLLYFCFRGVAWKDFWGALKSCRWIFVLLSMAFGVLAFLFRSLRWRMLLKPIDPSIGLRPVFNSVNISYVANMVLPRIGEFVRCGYVTGASSKGEDGKRLASYDKVLGTVVVDRVWDAATLFIILLGILALMWKRFGTFFTEKIFTPLAGRLNLDMTWLLISIAVVCIIGCLLVYFFRDKVKIFSKIIDIFKGIGQGIGSCLKMEKGWMFAVYTVAIWTMYWLQCLAIVWAFQFADPSSMPGDISSVADKIAALGGADALFLMTIGGISSLVPVPGGFGAFHYLVGLALQTMYGIPFAIGIIFATLSHESQALIQVICGGLSYADETLRKRSKE